MTEIERRKVPPDEIVGAMCVWLGCQEKFVFPEGNINNTYLPEDWRCLIVAKGSLFNAETIMNADVDGFLCPKHNKVLLGLLKTGRIIEKIK